ncbi:MAG: four helix bundle protein [Candidatus Falkowbacteria bacterium]
MEKNYLKLNDISAYKIAFHLSNYIWKIVVKWDYFSKKTIGDQFVRSTDSISSNIAEGFGRYNKKDKIRFYRYSFGSLKESFDWNEKSKVRKLLKPEEYNYIFTELQKLPKELHSLIKFTNNRLTI